MGFLVDILIDYGYWGMLLAAFLAGSFVPFSSEAIMLALMAAGLKPWPLVVYGTIGNVLGSVLNYCVGRLGKIEWMEHYLHVRPQDLARAERFMAGHGAMMGFFSFVPVLGSAISVLLGYMRANPIIAFSSIILGKFLRYMLLAYGVDYLVHS